METLEIMEAVSEWTGEDRLDDLLSHHYGLNLLKAKPVGGVLRIKTDRGSFAIKRVRQGEKERWRMLAEWKKYLNEGNKTMGPLPEMTLSNKPFFRGFRHSYVLLPWVRGNDAVLRQKEDWEQVTTKLAELHEASKGFTPSSSYRELSHTGRWMNKWEKEVQLSEIFHLAAKWTTSPTVADRFWLRTASYTTSLLENLMEYYDKIDGDKICVEAEESGKLCHGNLHGSNIIQDKNGDIQFVDWNEAIFNVRAHDLAQWIMYAFGRTGSKEVMKSILSRYNEISPLAVDEYSLIYARLLYPERLIRTLEAIYEKDEHQENHPMAATVIKKLTKMEEKKEILFQAFSSLVKEEYKIRIPVLDWMHKVV